MRILILARHIVLIGLWHAVLCLNIDYAWGQSDSSSMYQLQISKDLPLDQVLQGEEVKFFAANRQWDSLKHIALNVSVLTKEHLRQAGASNLPEALALFPEFIIKPKANGLYNIEYRGNKNNFHSMHQGNAKEQVVLLINAVPFNDALSGEVWWESVPVSIEDIENIELIRSPHGTWYGYGGALGIINIVTKKSQNTAGTQIKANLQAGQFQSYDYHGSLNIGINEHLSVRIGAHYQERNRFQDSYYISSVSRYMDSDSLLFFQPEAVQTNLYTDLSLKSSSFYLSSAYQWNDTVYLRINLGNHNTQAQSIFTPAEEIPLTIRALRNLWVDAHFYSPTWRSHIFHQSGNRDYASGYAGLQFQTARTGARLEYHKKVGRFGLLAGTEWLKDQYSPQSNALSTVPLRDSVTITEQWSQLLASVYLQQTAIFFNKSLFIESGQRIYQSLQDLSYPLGYHFAAKWLLKSGISIHASTAQVIHNTQQLLLGQEVQYGTIKTSNHEFGIQKQLNTKGIIKASAFNQRQHKNRSDNPLQVVLPQWGSTLEAWYHMNRWTFRGHATKYLLDDTSDQPISDQPYPSWSGSISANFTTFFDRINLYANLFYYSEHAELLNNSSYSLPSQWTVNTKCSYKVWRQHSLYINVRNLTNVKTVVVPFADQNHRLIMLGLNISL